MSANDNLRCYKIIRSSQRGRPRTIKRNLTLAEAQEHCRDPETSWRTCTTATGRARTRRVGNWFDGYTEQKE